LETEFDNYIFPNFERGHHSEGLEGACLRLSYHPLRPEYAKVYYLILYHNRCIYPFSIFDFFAIVYWINGGLAQGNPGVALSFGDDEMDRGRLDDVTDKSQM
jgi:hypothetical protein